MLARWIVRANNALVRLRRVRVPPDRLLLLIPRCLHRDACPQNVVGRLDDCRRCGQCRLAELLALRDTYGLIACVAGGGQQALAQTRRPEVKAVVAVACNKELVHGIFSAFPKPVLAVSNQTPEGPCRNTDVDLARVAAAVRALVAAK